MAQSKLMTLKLESASKSPENLAKMPMKRQESSFSHSKYLKRTLKLLIGENVTTENHR